ncbi:aldo/keto reductase [Bacteroides helcogenes]|uniref:Aldo/keto reductase n=1 Tax=Bacteroides helcogenes (strain ATCC 35417 / DSM 20613 / JCM 6297 / CCUG 15421 / P 36-108) TaxID=693979 RepID=E6SQ03_BACT6|nr:aldo/keto reductase [Bacteroides helcogenes]ADV42908.1 aldo/keto reductase [Bacteroides helcogenes P 36-108]MDY5237048.1 aldo/keto reductase [Bacteroides helcogenes]
MEYITLSNDVQMPILGFGVYQIETTECERCVEDAFDVGYRLIDTAAAYMNEAAVGRAIKNSGIKREELFITTKLWLQDAGYDSAKTAFYRSLDRLGLDYLDLYLVHKPLGDYYGAWRALEDLYRKGLIRAIGVCNFYPDRLVDLCCNAKIKPMINQMETHVFWQHNGYQQIMNQYDVALQSWGTFVEGRNGFFNNSLLKSIGDKHGKSVAQVALRWLIQRGIVCIPKSLHRERMEQNFDVFDFSLSDEEMNEIKKLDTHHTLFYSHYDYEKVELLNHIRYDI